MEFIIFLNFIFNLNFHFIFLNKDQLERFSLYFPWPITIWPALQGREYLIQTIQEDIAKAHRKLEELNQKQQYEEFEREKDRMQRYI